MQENLTGTLTAFDKTDSGFVTYSDLKSDIITARPCRMAEEQADKA
jgi:hypothetical protein